MRYLFALATLFIAMGCFSPCPSTFAQEAEYELRFDGRWLDSQPRPFSAHFTQVIGATHNSAGSLFGIGELASQGVGNVAELGSTGVLINEINSGIQAGTIDQLIEGTDTFIDPEEVDTFRFFANSSHSNVSFLTMIAPSPDWFVGVHDVDLLNSNGGWRSQIVIDLMSYDAGTEDGTGFSLSNPPTNPQDVIQALDDAEPTGALFGVDSIARVTFTRISPIPEPSSAIVLVGLTVLGIGSRCRRAS